MNDLDRNYQAMMEIVNLLHNIGAMEVIILILIALIFVAAWIAAVRGGDR